ncbi:MAG: hypothetical protein AAFP81_15905 [Pseudomonadota bacterium]
MDKTLLFWMVVGVVGFAFALAVQMRIVTALVLRRALGAWRTELTDRVKANTAVVWAAAARPMPDEAKPWLTDAVGHLRETYPNPLRHLRTARRYSIVLPVVLFGVLVLGRTVLGVI